MRSDKRFIGLSGAFWANVRLISQEVGYTVRGEGTIRVPTWQQIQTVYSKLSLQSDHLFDEDGCLTELGKLLLDYFEYRSEVLQKCVRPMLMDATEAKEQFKALSKKLKPTCPIPMNKQRGKKKAPAYFTGIINMLIESNAGGFSCDYDPRVLTTITKESKPVRTLARRVDGAFPSALDPVAVWEIKEYYYTTTFGSRVADGVYETLLDGMEIKELSENEGAAVNHYLMVDAYYTWWDCGRSYLCRIIDMLHMGYVDEVLFGREVIDRIPTLVKQWVAVSRQRDRK